MKNETLDKLVSKGDILYYEYQNLDEEGNPGESEFRNTERLTFLFPAGIGSPLIPVVPVNHKTHHCSLVNFLKGWRIER